MPPQRNPSRTEFETAALPRTSAAWQWTAGRATDKNGPKLCQRLRMGRLTEALRTKSIQKGVADVQVQKDDGRLGGAGDVRRLRICGPRTGSGAGSGAEAPAAEAPAAAAPAEPPRDPKTVVAKVGEMTVTEREVSLAAEAFANELTNVPEQQKRSVLVDAVVNMKLMALGAQAAGLDKGEEFDRPGGIS